MTTDWREHLRRADNSTSRRWRATAAVGWFAVLLGASIAAIGDVWQFVGPIVTGVGLLFEFFAVRHVRSKPSDRWTAV